MTKDKTRQRARQRLAKEKARIGLEQISPSICLVGRNVVTLNRTTGLLRCNCVNSLRGKSCEHIEALTQYIRRRDGGTP